LGGEKGKVSKIDFTVLSDIRGGRRRRRTGEQAIRRTSERIKRILSADNADLKNKKLDRKYRIYY